MTDRVALAWLHQDKNGTAWSESLVRMIAYDKHHGNHLLHPSNIPTFGFAEPGAIRHNDGVISVWGRGLDLAYSRNVAVQAFLRGQDDWLLWIDDDMGFTPDTLEKLLAVADPERAPVIGGLCFGEDALNHDGYGGLTSSLAPTIYDWTWLPTAGGYKLLTRTDYRRDGGLERVAATGSAMILIHRSVFERISRWCVEGGAPDNIWYQRIPGPDGAPCGEDISFCMRVTQLDIPIFVHTGVKTTHQKTIWYGEDHFDQKPFNAAELKLPRLPIEEWPKLRLNRKAVEEARKASPMVDKPTSRAQERTAVIVPVMKRPQNAKPFMDSLIASADPSLVSVYAVADHDDLPTREAWEKAGAEVVTFDWGRPGTFAEKVNLGYKITQGEPWIFLVGDDVKFHPDWLDKAQHAASTYAKQVIGTNDLGNPLVIAGMHATHILLAREYIEKHGGGWDGPGVVCHEGYRHWYVDDEIVTAAKQRNEWYAATDSIVEHLHPFWSKAKNDEVYEIGKQHSAEDRAKFNKRKREFMGQLPTVMPAGAA